MLGARLSKFERSVALERLFTLAIEAADLCYVVGHKRADIEDGSYYGVTVASEIAFADACGKPVIAQTKLSPTLDHRDNQENLCSAFASTLPVYSPAEVAGLIGSAGSVSEVSWYPQWSLGP